MSGTWRILMSKTGISILAAALLVSGCGGSSSPSSQGSLQGTAVKGPVAGATVTAYSIVGGLMGPEIASINSDSQGNFSLSLGDYSGSVILKMSGGSYTDEASGTNMSMMSGNVMMAAIPMMKSGQVIEDVEITPLTSMAEAFAQHMAGGLTEANISSANNAVGHYFMISDILHTAPMNPLVPGSGSDANQDEINYGMTLAAMSQYAQDMGMMSSSYFVTAMMQDASDGMIDGESGGTQITMGGMMGSGAMMQSDAGSSGLATAMMNYSGSSMNLSGVTAADMHALIQQLATCSGQL